MSLNTVAVLGATGLIGGQLVELLEADAAVSSIRILSRRPVDITHPKIRVIVLDFTDADAFRSAITSCDAVFCSVGTTQRKVKGDAAAYRKVDYDIPVHAAQYCLETGCPRFLLVSAVGADSKSGNFYTRLKGEVEDKIRSMGLPLAVFFRPSLLLGNRAEFRLGERIGEWLMRPLSFLLPARYKPIAARDVAGAMLRAAKSGDSGVAVWEYREMKAVE
ncbi:MAG: NAD(P)H-binding protein [Saprospiraceae bacterium]|nr:NAD(P)H-binding protein [Saprospiraceae bacterium]